MVVVVANVDGLRKAERTIHLHGQPPISPYLFLLVLRWNNLSVASFDSIKQCCSFLMDYELENSRNSRWNYNIPVPFPSLHVTAFLNLLRHSYFEVVSSSFAQSCRVIPSFQVLSELMDYFAVVNPIRWWRTLVTRFFVLMSVDTLHRDGELQYMRQPAVVDRRDWHPPRNTKEEAKMDPRIVSKTAFECFIAGTGVPTPTDVPFPLCIDPYRILHHPWATCVGGTTVGEVTRCLIFCKEFGTRGHLECWLTRTGDEKSWIEEVVRVSEHFRSFIGER